MADFKKFSNFAGKKFGGGGFKKPYNDGGGFKKPFDNDEGGGGGGFNKWGFNKFEKSEWNEDDNIKGMLGGEKKEWEETEGEEKTEEETVEAVIELFDKLAPLVEKLRK